MKEIVVSNGLYPIITQALEEMKSEQGDSFRLEEVNLSELERRTGISRAKLRRLKKDGFKSVYRSKKKRKSILDGYTSIIDNLLSRGIRNSSVCFECLKRQGYPGGITIVKDYIFAHKHLLPPKRQQVAPQGNRGRRFSTEPGEAYQMDWGFVNVVTDYGPTIKCACFAMICHHCGQCYIEFFPNAKQENLFIGMLHAFRYMGVPKYVLTDNMKSVVIKRDYEGHPVWQKDYEDFMKAVGFQTKLCKPRHPFTKGKVERLVRFVKDNFLPGRTFLDVTDLNRSALDWCNEQNSVYHRAIDCIPLQIHTTACSKVATALAETQAIRLYLCPLRKISFDGFVNYEGRRFGVPFRYTGSLVRVQREDIITLTRSLKVPCFNIEIAGIPVEIRCRFSENEEFLKDYITDKEPLFVVDPKAEDLEQIQFAFDCLDKADGMNRHRLTDRYLENNAIHAIMAEKLVAYNILLMHGSALCMDGQAIIFIAPSGTGKSTHARLWREVYGDRVWMINDDKPMLRIEQDKAIVCGTPWDGKHHLSRNASAPLKAIVCLRRDETNHIEPMGKADAFAALMKQYFNTNDPVNMMRIVKLKRRLLQFVSFYSLGCNKEPDAARVAWEGMNAI